MSKLLPYTIRHTFFVGVLLLLLSSCQSGPSASHYAQHFCDCSDEFSKAAVQLKAGTIDRATYEALQTAHETCMGEDDPLEDLKDDPEALQAFKANFVLEIEKRIDIMKHSLIISYLCPIVSH